ncbi:hypothetical protein J6590_096177 [Homalodisca vitripennis]|nr:hypothetical protein J6590_096177 [Homalodisca vitripennis]
MEENEEPCLRNSEIDRILLVDVTDGMAENLEEEGDADAEDTPLDTSVESIPSTSTSAPCLVPIASGRVTPSIDISVPGPSSAPSGLPQSLIDYVFGSDDDTLDPDFMPEADNLFGDR